MRDVHQKEPSSTRFVARLFGFLMFPQRTARSQPAFRFGAGLVFFAVLCGLSAGGARLPPAILAFSADIRSTTLLGACFLAAAIGRPFCFLDSSSCSAAS